MQFPKGSNKLDEAWEKLVDGVVAGDLWEIKVSALNDDYDNQVICIYTKDKNDLDDITRVYQYLVDQQLLVSHLAEEINGGELRYKTDEQTRLGGKSAGTAFTQYDIREMQNNRSKLQIMLNKIEHHAYVLHGGRDYLPDSKKKCSRSAAIVAKLLKDCLTENNNCVSIKKYDALVRAISKELRPKQLPTRGSWFFGLGGRDISTAKLYREIVSLCTSGKKQSVLKNDRSIPAIRHRLGN